MARLGVMIYPSEGLKYRHICCRLNIGNDMKEREQVGIAKEGISRPCRSQTCDTLIKSQVLSFPKC